MMKLTMIRRARPVVWLVVLLVVGSGTAAIAAPSGAAPGPLHVGGARSCEWVHTPTPKVKNGSLDAVAAISRQDGWAVGFIKVPGNFSPLVMRFDGSWWSQVAVEPSYGRLNAIDATSRGDVWALGQDGYGGTLALHFDGTGWTQVPSPSRGIFSYFLGVAAPATDDVWAVGDWEDANLLLHPLMEHWDGSAWRIVQAPDGAFFEDVSAAGPDDVWAVGSGFGGGSQPFAHFDGMRWTAVPGPSLGGDPYSLYGISAVAPGLAWAAGYRVSDGGNGSDRSLVLRWNGTRWRAEQTPDVAAALEGITVGRKGGRPVAVGYVEEPTTTFALGRHGDGFVQVPSWNPPHADFTPLIDVSIDQSSGIAWAVGGFGLRSGLGGPVIERLSCRE